MGRRRTCGHRQMWGADRHTGRGRTHGAWTDAWARGHCPVCEDQRAGTGRGDRATASPATASQSALLLRRASASICPEGSCRGRTGRPQDLSASEMKRSDITALSVATTAVTTGRAAAAAQSRAVGTPGGHASPTLLPAGSVSPSPGPGKARAASARAQLSPKATTGYPRRPLHSGAHPTGVTLAPLTSLPPTLSHSLPSASGPHFLPNPDSCFLQEAHLIAPAFPGLSP